MAGPSNKRFRGERCENRCQEQRSPRLQVIVDCDAGLDDAMALFVLLAGEAHKEIDILGVTCVNGNTNVKNVSINVLRTLQVANRLDIPVYVGAEKPLIPSQSISKPYYGDDGFGDANLLQTPDTSLIKEESAVEYLNKMACQNKGEITLLCLGPLTNIGLAIRTYSQFAESIKDIFIMGGNYKGVGNATAAAEFNFHSDPEAAHIVLSSVRCPITLVPWEANVDIDLPWDWRHNVLGRLETPQINLLNFAEQSLLEKKKKKPERWGACDSMAVAVLLRPSIVTKSHKCHLSVELHGEKTRGQAVVDHLKENVLNVEVIENIDCQMFKDLLYWAVEKDYFK